MTYIPENSKVVYQSKDGKEEKVFDALEWLVPPTRRDSQVPSCEDYLYCDPHYPIETCASA